MRAWRHTESTQYPGYEKLVDTTTKAPFEEKLRTNKVFAGTPDEVRKQLDAVVSWFSEDIAVTLGIHSGHLDAACAERSMRLFAERVMPFFPANEPRVPAPGGVPS